MTAKHIALLALLALAPAPAAAQLQILTARDQEVWIHEGLTRSVALDYTAAIHRQVDLAFEITSVAEKLRIVEGGAALHRIVVKAREGRSGSGEIRWRLCSLTRPIPCTPEATLTVHIRPTTALNLVPNDDLWPDLWGLHGSASGGIDAAGAWWLTTDCTRKIVAVVDTGTDYTHPDLAANIWINPYEIPGNGMDDDQNGYEDDVHGYDFAGDPGAGSGDPDPYPYDPDCVGWHPAFPYSSHGTMTAGIIGAVGDNEIGTAGVCWDAQLMIVKAARCILDEDGHPDWGLPHSAILEGLAYADANGAKISNNSYGHVYQSATGNPVLSELLDDLRAAGHIFVASAGNDGVNLDGNNDNWADFASYPQNNVVAVGSILGTGAYDVSGSNRGTTTVDLAAPGDPIVGLAVYAPWPDPYGEAGGTSFAAPHAAGTLALAWSYRPELTWTDARRSVLEGAIRSSQYTSYVRLGRQLSLGGALAPLAPGGGCGLGAELALVVPLLRALRGRRRGAGARAVS